MTGERPLISVIIPTRNRVAFLPDVLGALGEQVCEATFEVIVVDNGSTDRTGTFLAERSASQPRLRWLHEPVLGRSVAMNAGVRASRGSLLLFTDDDVMMGPDWIESYRRFFASRPPTEIVVVGGPIHPVANDLGPWPAWLGEDAVADLVPLDLGGAERILRPPEYVWGANMAVRARVLDRIGGWDPDIGRRGDDRGTYEDVEYQDRVRAVGGSVWYNPVGRVFHRVPPELVTPARIMSNAFARGRNAAWGEEERNAGVEDERPSALVGRFLVWAADTIAFRARRGPRTFDRARLAAAAAGAAMERCLRHGDRGGAVARASWWAGRIVVRLAGGSRADHGGPVTPA
ncbi:MAG TPA: glycosyltransferase [Actinomycetota bacterium]